jgi:hypothetical protein
MMLDVGCWIWMMLDLNDVGCWIWMMLDVGFRFENEFGFR